MVTPALASSAENAEQPCWKSKEDAEERLAGLESMRSLPLRSAPREAASLRASSREAEAKGPSAACGVVTCEGVCDGVCDCCCCAATPEIETASKEKSANIRRKGRIQSRHTSVASHHNTVRLGVRKTAGGAASLRRERSHPRGVLPAVTRLTGRKAGRELFGTITDSLLADRLLSLTQEAHRARHW